jgi:hypothetical protein
MNSQQPFDFLKKGLHVTLGATTALVESVQDARKREENLAQLNLGFDELTQRWADKGASTEVEARQFVDTVIANTVGQPPGSSSSTPNPQPSVDINPQLILELQDLTAELATIRAALEHQMDAGT